MPSRVTFASARPQKLRADATLPALLDRMLGSWDFKTRFDGKRVAVKMHLGGNMGFSTIHPLLVGRVIKAVKEAGGKPFVCDAPWAVASAAARGYTAETLGCDILPVAGLTDKYIYSRKVGYRTMETVELAGEVLDADALLVLSHGKGHGLSGFGGAIKNIAMGCVDGATRGKIHRLIADSFKWHADKCTHCLLCRDNCPNDAINDKDGKISIFDHHCKYCLHCELACPTKAITIDLAGYRWFQHGMALTTNELIRKYDAGSVMYVTVLMNITPFCDCWGFTTPSIVPDIGIVASDDIVAIEQASVDLIKAEDFIAGSLPAPLARDPSRGGHLLQQIHAKDPCVQIEECAALGMGSRQYSLEMVQ
jgi:uncharacterized Fe-S center protein